MLWDVQTGVTARQVDEGGWDGCVVDVCSAHSFFAGRGWVHYRGFSWNIVLFVIILSGKHSGMSGILGPKNSRNASNHSQTPCVRGGLFQFLPALLISGLDFGGGSGVPKAEGKNSNSVFVLLRLSPPKRNPSHLETFPPQRAWWNFTAI